MLLLGPDRCIFVCATSLLRWRAEYVYLEPPKPRLVRINGHNLYITILSAC